MIEVCRRAAILALLASVVAALLAAVHPRAPHWSLQLAEGELTLAMVEERAADRQLIWVDARSAEEFAAGHIPGAIRVAEDDWDTGFMALMQAWQPEALVVVYCDERRCDSGHQVAERLRDETGFDDIHELYGGWQAWRER